MIAANALEMQGTRSGPRARGFRWLASLGLAVVMLGSPVQALSVGGNGWGVPELIEDNPLWNSVHVDVAIDGQGRGIAAWEFNDGGVPEVHATRYVPGAGWQFPEKLTFYAGGDASDPSVAMDDQGNGRAVFVQVLYGQNQIVTAAYSAGSGWGLIEILANNYSADQRNPEIVMGPAGQYAVVWVQCCDPAWEVWGIVVDPKATPMGAMQLNEGSAVNAAEPRVGVDGKGGAVAVWVDDVAGNTTLTGSLFTSEVGWGAPVPVEDATGIYIVEPSIAVDDAGNALALWERSQASAEIVASHFTKAGGWERTQVLGDTLIGPSEEPRVAMNGKGEGIAVWHGYTASKNTIRARSFTPAAGWSATAEIDGSDHDEGRASPDVAMDAAGNGVIVWVEGGPTGFDLACVFYTPGAGWSGPSLVEDVAASVGHQYNGGGAPRVAVSAGGAALVAWAAGDGGNWQLMGNAYQRPDVTPPPLSLAAPADGAVTNRSAITVSGLSEAGVRVSVNGVEATVASNGSFSLLLGLQPGVNSVTARAWDAAGNSVQASLTVRFDDPVPGLEGQLADAQAALTAAAADLAGAQADLASLSAQSNSTQAQLAAAEANVTAAQERLDAAGLQAAATASQLIDARALLNQTRAELATTQAQLAETRAQFNASNTTVAPPGAAADLGPVTALAIVGIAVGGAGLAVNFMRPRKGQLPPEGAA